MTRRDILVGGGTLAISAMGRAAPYSQPLEGWLLSPRMLIAEGYFAPFQPRLRYDAERALAIAERVNADSIRFPSLSLYAFYPTRTKYPLHPDLTGRDLLGDTVELFQRSGRRVLAYLPVNQGFLQVSQGPQGFDDCLRRYANGQPMITDRFTYATCYETCLNSPIREFIKDYTKEVLTRYPVDAIFFDGPHIGGDQRNKVCHCKYCQSAYRKATGKTLPPDPGAKLTDDQIEYFEWIQKDVTGGMLVELCDMIRQTRKVPVLYNNTSLIGKRDTANRAFGVTDGFMFEYGASPERKLCNLQLGRSTGKVVWTYVGSYGSGYHEHLTNKHVFGWYSFPLENQELLMDGAVALSAGTGMLYWGLNRLLPAPGDPLSYPSGRYLRENFDFSERHQGLLNTLKAAPVAGVLVGTQTTMWYEGPRFVAKAYGNCYYGAFNLMKDCGYDAEPFLDYQLSPERLAGYRLVYVPNAPCLSDEQCAVLSKYVEQGGTLLATHLTSTANVHGRPRKDYGLAALLGIRLKAPEPVETPDVYARKLADQTLVPQDHQYVLFEALDSATVLAETVDGGRWKVVGPSVVTRAYGKGRVIYIGWSLEAAYDETRMPVLREYFQQLVDPVLGSHRRYQVEHRAGLLPHLMVSSSALVLHLLADTGNKSTTPYSTEEFVPLENVSAKIRIPKDGKVRSVELLRGNRQVPFRVTGEWVELTVPRITVHEAIHVAL